MAKVSNFNGKVVKSVVQSKKISFGSKIRVVVISDLHNYTTDREQASRLAEEIKRQNPDFVFIAGDIFNIGKQWEDETSLSGLWYFLGNVSEVAPVFITWGNHDIVGTTDKNREERLKNLRLLEKARPGEVYPLYNECVIVKGMEVMGFVPTLGILGGLSNQLHGIAHDKFIDMYEKKGTRFSSDPSRMKTYLGHNPHLIAASENGVGLGSLKVCDFFVTGHLHNGYKLVIEHLRKMFKMKPKELSSLAFDKGWVEQPIVVNRKGLPILTSLYPVFMGHTNLCRGIVYIDDDAQQKYLQLPDGNMYKNASSKPNVQVWEPILPDLARKEIMDDDLSCMIISEGINPGFISGEEMATMNTVDFVNTVDSQK